MTAGQACSDEVVRLAVLALEIALRRVPKQEAQEIAQGAIAAYLQRQDHVDNAAAYVTRVTYNLILELQEHQRRYLSVGDLPDIPSDTGEDEDMRVLDQILAKVFVQEYVDPVLSERERKTMMLTYGEGLSRQDVAERLGVKPETVKDTLRRAKRKIQKRSARAELLRRPAL